MENFEVVDGKLTIWLTHYPNIIEFSDEQVRELHDLIHSLTAYSESHLEWDACKGKI
jgi:hypothetical protein